MSELPTVDSVFITDNQSLAATELSNKLSLLEFIVWEKLSMQLSSLYTS